MTQDSAAQIVTLVGTVARLGRNEQPAIHLWQIGLHKQCLTLAHTTPGKIAQRAAHQLLNIGDGFIVFGGADADPDPVIREGLEHFLRRNEYFATIIQHGKAIASLGAFDHRFSVLFFGLHLGLQALQLREGILVKHWWDNL